MTARDIYDAMLIETNKKGAPIVLLEDFNYMVNKAVYQLTNKKYNRYDVDQQSTDDLRVLKTTAVLTPKEFSKYGDIGSLYGKVSEFELPVDYLHLLNCICDYKVQKNYKCHSEGTYLQAPARRLTSDLWPQIINNFYMKPTYKNPYYFIHNVNKIDKHEEGLYTSSVNIPTNPAYTITDESTQDNPKYEYIGGTDMSYEGYINLPKTIPFNGTTLSTINSKKTAGHRYGNVAPVRLEIRWGNDNSVFELERIYVDYIKTPQHIELTQEQLDLVEDTSQIMEFPDYVCHEIINELVKLIMENASDPRLQTNIPINQTIASPAPQGQ